MREDEEPRDGDERQEEEEGRVDRLAHDDDADRADDDERRQEPEEEDGGVHAGFSSFSLSSFFFGSPGAGGRVSPCLMSQVVRFSMSR